MYTLIKASYTTDIFRDNFTSWKDNEPRLSGYELNERRCCVLMFLFRLILPSNAAFAPEQICVAETVLKVFAQTTVVFTNTRPPVAIYFYGPDFRDVLIFYPNVNEWISPGGTTLEYDAYMRAIVIQYSYRFLVRCRIIRAI